MSAPGIRDPDPDLTAPGSAPESADGISGGATADSCPRHRVIAGDPRAMPEFEDGSVRLVIAMPPPWRPDDTPDPADIGRGGRYETWLESLRMVFAECARVLAPGCRLCVNLADRFLSAGAFGHFQVLPVRDDVSRILRSLDLHPMGTVIWQTAAPGRPGPGPGVMGSWPYPRNGILRIDYESLLLFRRPGETPPPSAESREASRLSADEWNRCFSGHWNLRSTRRRGDGGDIPLEIPERLIRMFTFAGETVLDPFLGTGTTLLAAEGEGRRLVGYAGGPDALDVIRERLGLFATGVSFESRSAPSVVVSTPARLEVPPPEPRGREAPARPALRVAAVEAVNRLRLAGGDLVLLAGVQPMPGDHHRGREHLRRLIGRGLVEVEDCPGGAYVRLTNRTLLNARLIRTGHAVADPAALHRMAARFLRYEEAARDARRGLWRLR